MLYYYIILYNVILYNFGAFHKVCMHVSLLFLLDYLREM